VTAACKVRVAQKRAKEKEELYQENLYAITT